MRDASRINALLRKLYHTERWRRERRAFLDQSPACSDCAAAGKLEPATDVHHKRKPKSEAEFFDRSFFGALCHSCHSKRTARGE
jgi:5-methylcytosine-specific restriction protein A